MPSSFGEKVLVKSFFTGAVRSSEELTGVELELLVPSHSLAFEQVGEPLYEGLLHTSNKLAINSHGVTLHLSQVSYALVVFI